MSEPDNYGPRKNLRPGELMGHLSDLKRGQKGVVLDFHNDNAALRRHLLDMGITKGVVIEIKKIAPLGDPVSTSNSGVTNFACAAWICGASILRWLNNMIIGLVGNQNAGKTTLFNLLTGSNQKVGNWPASRLSVRKA
jgi:Fe2+ transport system protein FeoA